MLVCYAQYFGHKSQTTRFFKFAIHLCEYMYVCIWVNVSFDLFTINILYTLIIKYWWLLIKWSFWKSRHLFCNHPWGSLKGVKMDCEISVINRNSVWYLLRKQNSICKKCRCINFFLVVCFYNLYTVHQFFIFTISFLWILACHFQKFWNRVIHWGCRGLQMTSNSTLHIGQIYD